MTKEELDKDIQEISEDLEKLDEQKNPVDKQVDEQLNQMGFLWDRVHEKLKKDNTCFHTKKLLVAEGQDPKDVKIHVVEATNTEKGIVAFVSLSDEAVQEIQKQKQEELEKEKAETEEVKEDK